LLDHFAILPLPAPTKSCQFATALAQPSELFETGMDTQGQAAGSRAGGRSNFDVVIVGAGIAGGALATALARSGIAVLLLEKTRFHQDRVRGESMVPWGVSEADRLGVLDVLLDAGGHYTPIGIPYGEGISTDAARARAIDVRRLLPEVGGSLTFSHPRICQALNEAAQAAGAVMLRQVENVAVTPGSPPKISFVVDGQHREIAPRLVVGADGRGSTVARQIGAQIEVAPQHHLMAGLLIEDCEAWPAEEFAIGTEGDVTYYVFPQGDGRIRLYLCYGADQARRFSGPGNAQRFLDAFRLTSLPHSEELATAKPAGPCRGYPNADAWIDSPLAPGVILIGDAAGHNDPTIGQGLSISFRDARLVHEILRDNTRWTDNVFMPFVEERRERLRRLRFTGQQYSILRVEFSEPARARRRRALERMAADPTVALPLLAVFKGPFGLPDDAYEQVAWNRLLN
jgi:2-polyprenyl-6-methoxyphenol hydroxylase-like FAD-dependent oxidoreductase